MVYYSFFNGPASLHLWVHHIVHTPSAWWLLFTSSTQDGQDLLCAMDNHWQNGWKGQKTWRDLCYNVQLSGPQLVPATLTTHGHQPRPASPELSLNSIFWIYGPITSSRLHYFLYIASTQFLPTHNVQGLLPTSTTDYGSSLTQKISINSSFFGCYSTTDTCFILIIVMANYILNLVDNGG